MATATAIPIQNIYFLLCYAWNRWAEGSAVDVSSVTSPRLADLFAHVLIEGINHLFRRGLDRGYVTTSEDTSSLRGRIDFGVSLKRMLLPQTQAHCVFDELDYDVLHNRILLSTLRRLRRVEGLNDTLRHKAMLLTRKFAGVAEVPLTGSLFRRVQLHGNNAFYRFLLDVCELIHHNLLPTESAGRLRFRDFRQDQQQMWQIFEDFVFRFYEREQSAFRMRRQWTLAWDARVDDPATAALLPQMNVDILLESPDRVILIDTKFYRDTLQFGQYAPKLHSAHLYQLFAYLKNAARRGGAFARADGILLYPTVGYRLDERFEIQGHQVRVRTIDLAREWREIHDGLLQLISPRRRHVGTSDSAHETREARLSVRVRGAAQEGEA